jgi:glycosyltransferase involved in cell wall biosynthesis
MSRMRAEVTHEPVGHDDAVICFSGQDWWYHNRAHSDFQLMRRAAETRTVLFVNSIGMRMPLPGRSTQPMRRILRKVGSIARFLRTPLPETPRFHVLSPVVLPFYGIPWVRRLNTVLVTVQVRLAARRLGIRRPACVVTIPTAWPVVNRLDVSSVTFNRSDKQSEFEEVDQSYIRELEEALLRGSDRVMYVSHALMDAEAPLTGDRARFLDHGVDLELFHQGLFPHQDLAAIPSPRIGFFGGFDDYVIDMDLLEHLAKSVPDAQVVLIGDATCSMDRLTSQPNVHWLGYRPYEEIPRFGAGFDVAIMPWLRNGWIEACNPIKLKEYLALGLPIVSTDFPEVTHYADVVRVAADADSFVELVRQSLSDRGPSTPEQRRAVVAGSSWDRRAADMLAICDEASASRRSR